MKNLLVAVAVLVGVLLVVAGGVYAALPAHSLPTFFPGYDATLTKHHYTHAVASVGLGFVFFAFAWMKSGKKSSSK